MKEINTAIENQGLTRASGAGLLGRKCAVVFGAAGSIGAAVAKEFAAEGARVFLAGRTKDSLEAVAKQITNARGEAQTTVVDALDDAGVNRYLDGVAKQAGKIDNRGNHGKPVRNPAAGPVMIWPAGLPAQSQPAFAPSLPQAPPG